MTVASAIRIEGPMMPDPAGALGRERHQRQRDQRVDDGPYQDLVGNALGQVSGRRHEGAPERERRIVGQRRDEGGQHERDGPAAAAGRQWRPARCRRRPPAASDAKTSGLPAARRTRQSKAPQSRSGRSACRSPCGTRSGLRTGAACRPAASWRTSRGCSRWLHAKYARPGASSPGVYSTRAVPWAMSP